MQKPKFSSEYYNNVGTYRICRKLVPGWYYQIHAVNQEQVDNPWYFTYFPNFPTYLCDIGHVVRVPFAKRSTEVFKWIYIDLGVHADEYGYPLGLSFLKGDPKKLPKYVLKVIGFIASKYGLYNIISEKEALLLAESQKTEKPVTRMSYFTRKTHSFTFNYKPHYYHYHKKKEKLEKEKEARRKRRKEACERKYQRRELKLKERRGNGHLQQDCLLEDCQKAD